MEHITVIDLDKDTVKLVPEVNYVLYDTRTSHTYSEAIVARKDMRYFKAKRKN